MPATSVQASEVTCTAEPSLEVVFDWLVVAACEREARDAARAQALLEVASVASKAFETSLVYHPLLPFGEAGVGRGRR